MPTLTAILLPCLLFFRFGSRRRGILALILQLTLIGWPVAILWALYMLYHHPAGHSSAKAGAPDAAKPADAKPKKTKSGGKGAK
ncbi:hypothetical protein [Sneathiella sp.]|uniref:hypothetical protein n=1 Tax=Sneathiella sp. TaxID=1964365 RepID=UPI0025F6486F|nr:hypothetical protein [Sneathiella sp.]